MLLLNDFLLISRVEGCKPLDVQCLIETTLFGGFVVDAKFCKVLALSFGEVSRFRKEAETMFINYPELSRYKMYI